MKHYKIGKRFQWMCLLLISFFLIATIPVFNSIPVRAVTNGETLLTYYGHSAFKLVTPSGKVLLIDPWITNPNNSTGKEDLAELDRVDLILISHGHFDHVGDAAQIAEKTGAKLVSTDDLGTALIEYGSYPQKFATPETRGNFGGTISLLDEEVQVNFVGAVHSSAITPLPDGSANIHNGGSPGGFIINVKDGPTVYHTGDTDLFSDMELISQFHKVNLMLVCIGDHATMGPERAARAVKLIAPDLAVPMHYGTFPLLTGTPEAFATALEEQNVDSELEVMQVHQTLKL